MVDPGFVLVMLACYSNAAPAAISGPIAIVLVMQQQPDTRKAKELDRWANEHDIAKLQATEGKPRWMVLLILGHPSRVERQADGVEVWDYPWVAACRVRLKNGVCTGTFYTAGY